MITEDYVSFEIAKLLKEKGFDHICLMWYIDSPNTISEKTGKPIPPYFTSLTDEDGNYYYNTERETFEYSAPTLQMTMKWLREKYNIYIAVNIGADVDNPDYIFYHPTIITFIPHKSITYLDGILQNDEYHTYEQAVEASINYCLTNLI